MQPARFNQYSANCGPTDIVMPTGDFLDRTSDGNTTGLKPGDVGLEVDTFGKEHEAAVIGKEVVFAVVKKFD